MGNSERRKTSIATESNQKGRGKAAATEHTSLHAGLGQRQLRFSVHHGSTHRQVQYYERGTKKQVREQRIQKVLGARSAGRVPSPTYA